MLGDTEVAFESAKRQFWVVDANVSNFILIWLVKYYVYFYSVLWWNWQCEWEILAGINHSLSQEENCSFDCIQLNNKIVP